jgi:hypothetical protein
MITKQDTALVREVVASAQIDGGTRVIVLTAREPQPHHFVVETVAFDSNHPGEHLGHGVYPGPNLAELLADVREHESHAFDPPENRDGCDCWAKWDPNCGQPGCWGVWSAPAVGSVAR